MPAWVNQWLSASKASVSPATLVSLSLFRFTTWNVSLGIHSFFAGHIGGITFSVAVQMPRRCNKLNSKFSKRPRLIFQVLECLGDEGSPRGHEHTHARWSGLSVLESRICVFIAWKNIVICGNPGEA